MENLNLSYKHDIQEINELSHDDFFNELRQTEYHRLDKDNHVYLDFTGGNLYAKSQLDKHSR